MHDSQGCVVPEGECIYAYIRTYVCMSSKPQVPDYNQCISLPVIKSAQA